MSKKVKLDGALFQSRMDSSEEALTEIIDGISLLRTESNALRSWSGEAKDNWINLFNDQMDEISESIYRIQVIAKGINELGIELANTQREASSLLNGFITSLV